MCLTESSGQWSHMPGASYLGYLIFQHLNKHVIVLIFWIKNNLRLKEMEIAHLKRLGWLTRICTWVWHETAVPDSCMWLSCWAWHQPPVSEITLLSLTLFSRINFILLGLTSSNCFWHHSDAPVTVLLCLASFCPVWQGSAVSCHHPAMSDITLPRVTSSICPWNHPGGLDIIQLCLTTSSCAWQPLPEPQSILLGLTSLRYAWNHPSVCLISSHCAWYHPAGFDIIQLCLTQSSVADIILLSLTTFPCVYCHADGHKDHLPGVWHHPPCAWQNPVISDRYHLVVFDVILWRMTLSGRVWHHPSSTGIS